MKIASLVQIITAALLVGDTINAAIYTFNSNVVNWYGAGKMVAASGGGEGELTTVTATSNLILAEGTP